jgi:hypothetical protein
MDCTYIGLAVARVLCVWETHDLQYVYMRCNRQRQTPRPERTESPPVAYQVLGLGTCRIANLGAAATRHADQTKTAFGG